LIVPYDLVRCSQRKEMQNTLWYDAPARCGRLKIRTKRRLTGFSLLR
jgi:hypothetical protein